MRSVFQDFDTLRSKNLSTLHQLTTKDAGSLLLQCEDPNYFLCIQGHHVSMILMDQGQIAETYVYAPASGNLSGIEAAPAPTGRQTDSFADQAVVVSRYLQMNGIRKPERRTLVDTALWPAEQKKLEAEPAAFGVVNYQLFGSETADVIVADTYSVYDIYHPMRINAAHPQEHRLHIFAVRDGCIRFHEDYMLKPVEEEV